MANQPALIPLGPTPFSLEQQEAEDQLFKAATTQQAALFDMSAHLVKVADGPKRAQPTTDLGPLFSQKEG